MSLLATPVVDVGLQTFLAFDFGTQRTGVATGNRLTCTASPQPTLVANNDQRLAAVALRIKEWLPDALVVGVPFHPDGAAHENTGNKNLARNWRANFCARIVFTCAAPSG